jgi:hypothetical protein
MLRVSPFALLAALTWCGCGGDAFSSSTSLEAGVDDAAPGRADVETPDTLSDAGQDATPAAVTFDAALEAQVEAAGQEASAPFCFECYGVKVCAPCCVDCQGGTYCAPGCTP